MKKNKVFLTVPIGFIASIFIIVLNLSMIIVLTWILFNWFSTGALIALLGFYFTLIFGYLSFMRQFLTFVVMDDKKIVLYGLFGKIKEVCWNNIIEIGVGCGRMNVLLRAYYIVANTEEDLNIKNSVKSFVINNSIVGISWPFPLYGAVCDKNFFRYNTKKGLITLAPRKKITNAIKEFYKDEILNFEVLPKQNT